MYGDNTELRVVDIKRSKRWFARAFSPPPGPLWSVGHIASRLRRNPAGPQSYFRSHVSCSSSTTSKPNSSWCRFSTQAHRDPPLRGAAPLNSPRRWSSAWEKSGQLFAHSSQLKPLLCQELSWFKVWRLFRTSWLQAVEALLFFTLLKADIVQKIL